MKPCLYCEKPLENRRKNYHPECIEPAKERAKLAQRKCKKCKKVKAPSSFVNDASRPDGKFPWCSDCQNEATKASWFQDPNDPPNGFVCPLDDVPVRGHRNRRFCSAYCKNRVAALKKNFDLSVEQYRSLVAQTEGRCPLCQNRVHTWHVDHNHRTREVMGVVCAACNVGALAGTYHNVEYVRRLLAFLENSPAAQLGIQVLVPEGKNKPSNLHKVWSTASRRKLAP